MGADGGTGTINLFGIRGTIYYGAFSGAIPTPMVACISCFYKYLKWIFEARFINWLFFGLIDTMHLV